MDCEYYLGHGNRAAKHLWALNEVDQINKMKELYNSLIPLGPIDWISLEDIEDYEEKMIDKD
jgi:hypothetical protein